MARAFVAYVFTHVDFRLVGTPYFSRHGVGQMGACWHASHQPWRLSLSPPHTLRYAYTYIHTLRRELQQVKASWGYRLGIVLVESILFAQQPTASLLLEATSNSSSWLFESIEEAAFQISGLQLPPDYDHFSQQWSAHPIFRGRLGRCVEDLEDLSDTLNHFHLPILKYQTRLQPMDLQSFALLLVNTRHFAFPQDRPQPAVDLGKLLGQQSWHIDCNSRNCLHVTF